MATISWDEGVPSDSDFYAGMAAQVRSLKTALATGLAGSMVWPGSGGGAIASAGSVLPGTARPFFSVQSNYSTQVSSTTVGSTSSATAFLPPGPLFVASDTARLFGQTWVSSATSTSGSTATTLNFSGATLFLGGKNLVESAVSVQSQKALNSCSIKTAMVADVLGSFGVSDTTVVSVTMPYAYPFVTASLWVESSLGTGMVRGMMATLTGMGGGVYTYALSVLSRYTSFPGVPSQTTAHLLVMSTGTVPQ